MIQRWPHNLWRLHCNTRLLSQAERAKRLGGTKREQVFLANEKQQMLKESLVVLVPECLMTLTLLRTKWKTYVPV